MKCAAVRWCGGAMVRPKVRSATVHLRTSALSDAPSHHRPLAPSQRPVPTTSLRVRPGLQVTDREQGSMAPGRGFMCGGAMVRRVRWCVRGCEVRPVHHRTSALSDAPSHRRPLAPSHHRPHHRPLAEAGCVLGLLLAPPFVVASGHRPKRAMSPNSGGERYIVHGGHVAAVAPANAYPNTVAVGKAMDMRFKIISGAGADARP